MPITKDYPAGPSARGARSAEIRSSQNPVRNSITAFTRQPDKTLAVLGLMRDLAERAHGYVALAVGGWARVEDVNDLLDVFYLGRPYVGVAGEELRKGFQRGHYDRIDVRVEGAARPVYMYRVTDEGARTLNRRENRRHVRIVPPAEGPEKGVWMPSTAPTALKELILAADNPGAPEYVPGEPEWRPSIDLTSALSSRVHAALKAREEASEPEVLGDRDPSFTPDDLRWHAAAGFAEERREGKKVLFRVTPAGRNARALEWRGPVPSFMKRPD